MLNVAVFNLILAMLMKCSFKAIILRLADCHVLVKVFLNGYILVTINSIAFIFYIQLPKDLGNTFPRYFCKNKKSYCKFRRFRQNFDVSKLLVKVFKSASYLEICYWIAFKLH